MNTSLVQLSLTSLIGMFVAATFSCSDDAVDDQPAGLPVVEVNWAPCPFVTGESTLDAECADVEMPADYSDPEGPTITVWVKRRLVANSTGQHWMLNGGPGGSVTDFETAVDGFTLRPDLDIYLLEHRGVGASTGLFCPNEEADGLTPTEYQACRAYVEDLHGTLEVFNTTAAAYDLATLIENTRSPSDEVFIYGVSYGTYWLHRYSQIAPEQADGLIFDSVCGPDECELSYSFAKGFDEIGRKVLEECRLDTDCSSRLPDPLASTQQLYLDLDAGHCPELGLTGDQARARLARIIMFQVTQPFLPAVVYRMERCSASDITVIAQFVSFMESTFDTTRAAPASTVLAVNVASSELFEEPTADQMNEIDDWVLRVSNVQQNVDIFKEWAPYTLDNNFNTLTETTVPALMLQGDFDPQTPPRVAVSLRNALNKPNQTYVEVPYSTHNVVLNSPTTNSTLNCGQQLMQQFLEDPKSTLDTSCTTATRKLDFSDTNTQLNQAILGADSMWN